ncbi:Manganese ABC transporter substrate-binding lipoprotein precursor [Corynebacterium felinum]|uniref:Anchored repeat ABC transporter substrate-binding protein n=1 Tax=Corynebacterium felinum TaxID=131318 RepID=A0ABU2BA15_9CORY|nr:anchored repeat ABC transporter, substrate-binding protein [Corynebacterium felinum]MDR7355121.1 anchored repeat ABC transporter substrate-binding protein [Corynebacterium felinum]WJY94472.1 Manganese ABC transporter substrate-binding lipoprotein precursor [Corynebacterium felinum]
MHKHQLTHAIVGLCAVSTLLVGCGGHAAADYTPSTSNNTIDVVATTPIIADLAQHVAGDRAHVTSLMPPGSDPHSFEPGLRSVRNIANADIVFTNGLLLEQQSLLKTAAESRLEHVPLIALAEESPRHGAQLIPLVENIALDTVWLGMRIGGTGEQLGAQRTSGVRVQLTHLDGPGAAAAYVTSTFGVPEVLFNTRDGINRDDSTTLPVDAHTHVSWAFSAPGVYELTFNATLDTPSGMKDVGTQKITIAVGVDPHSATALANPTVVDGGHIDITADLDQQKILIRGDAPTGTNTSYDYDPDSTVIFVPSTVLQQIPGDPTFRFLGNAGDETYLLPQAVLGKHVHGEVDPHLWHSVKNTIAMVRVIQDELTNIDQAGRTYYRDQADAYVDELSRLDTWMRERINTIPSSRRHLVTTHDGYAYLGKEYDINVAGFVTPNPAIEPSPRDVIALTRTLENLHVPAVFLEPKLAGRAGVLSETAARLAVDVCTIRSDTLDEHVTNYIDLMRTNTTELVRCLANDNDKKGK